MKNYRFVGHFNVGGIWSETASNENEFYHLWNKIWRNGTVRMDTIYGKDGNAIWSWNEYDKTVGTPDFNGGFLNNAPKFCTRGLV